MIDLIQAALSGDAEALKRYRKELEKKTIRTINAKVLLFSSQQAYQSYQKDVANTASQTKQSVLNAGAQLEVSITGNWSKSVQEAISQNAKRYDGIK